MLSDRQALMTLAERYSEAMGISLRAVGERSVKNHKFFVGISQGAGFQSRKAAEAMRWFQENWPEGIPWPLEQQAAE